MCERFLKSGIAKLKKSDAFGNSLDLGRPGKFIGDEKKYHFTRK